MGGGMFGHLNISLPNSYRFRTFQCSLCHALSADYGSMARFLTNYDVSLMLMVAISGAEKEFFLKKRLCPLLCRDEIIHGQIPILRFAAAVSVVLVSEKVKDDEFDEKRNVAPRVLSWLAKKRHKADSILRQLSFDASLISSAFLRQRELETQTDAPLNIYAEPTAQVMAALYAHAARLSGNFDHGGLLREAGYRLGHIIYLIDALVDYFPDVNNKIFNPLSGCKSSCAITNTGSEQIPAEALQQAIKLLNNAADAFAAALNSLPQSRSLYFSLAERIKEHISNILQTVQAPCKDSVSPRYGFCKSTTISLLSTPTAAFAADGSNPLMGCCQSLLPLAILYFGFNLMCRGKGCQGCCSSHPEKVTVDNGCGGQKTYRRDSCSGKYKEESGCC